MFNNGAKSQELILEGNTIQKNGMLGVIMERKPLSYLQILHYGVTEITES